ncbi:MAG: ribosome-associated translation inhibitor RaiA [Bacteroidia bacterium]|nr:ribosome-associated translation inhibitor RaiA [Bacteroidia bacterium]
MKVTIQSIHFTAATRLQAYIEQKLNKLDQFFDKIVGGNVILRVQPEGKGMNKYVEIHVSVPGDLLVAREEGRTFEEATDLVMDKLKSQLKRYKGRLQQ